MINNHTKLISFIIATIIALCTVPGLSNNHLSALIPLNNPVYTLIDNMPLPPRVNNISLTSRPLSAIDIRVVLTYALQNCSATDSSVIKSHLSRLDSIDTRLAMINLSLDSNRIFAYPTFTTTIAGGDSNFSERGYTNFAIDSLSHQKEAYNYTALGGVIESQLFGSLYLHASGRIITEYSSARLWLKEMNPRLGINHTTILSPRGQSGHFIGYDDFQCYAYIPLKAIRITAGVNSPAWGAQNNSGLLLSGNAPPFFNIKAQTTLGLLSYEFIWGHLLANTYTDVRMMYAKRIGFAPIPSVNVAFNDMVLSINRPLEPYYLIPFIPYYFLEHYIGDKDNRIMSFEGEWLVNRSIAAYGELVIDDVSNMLGIFKNVDANDKWGGLIGVKWFNPIPRVHSVARIEVLNIEPWTYTTSSRLGDSTGNQPVHFGALLGSLYGPHSLMGRAELQASPTPELSVNASIEFLQKGKGPGSLVSDRNEFVRDTIITQNGSVSDTTFQNRQATPTKDGYRFVSFSRERFMITGGANYSIGNNLMVALSGTIAVEQTVYWQAGVSVRVNY